MIPREIIQNKGSPDTVATELQEVGKPRCVIGGSGGGPDTLGSADLVALRKQVEAGAYNVTQDDRDKLVQLCRDYMAATDLADGRAQLRAAELMAALERDNLNKLIGLDKLHRLDNDLATERTEGVQIVIQRHETAGGELIEGNP